MIANLAKIRYTARTSKEVERKNSYAKRYPHPTDRGFFAPVPCPNMAGRATDTTPFGERSPLGFARVLNLPAALPDARKNVPAKAFKVSQRSVFMDKSILPASRCAAPSQAPSKPLAGTIPVVHLPHVLAAHSAAGLASAYLERGNLPAARRKLTQALSSVNQASEKGGAA